MSEMIYITLIIVIGIVIVLIVYKDKLSGFSLNADPTKKLQAKIKAHGPGVVISNASQEGHGNEMNISRDNVAVTDFKQTGKEHQLNVKENNQQ